MQAVAIAILRHCAVPALIPGHRALAAEVMPGRRLVASRLPATFAALGAGLIHPVHVRIIEDETRVLSEADAALADESWPRRRRPRRSGSCGTRRTGWS